ncbi:MAG: glucosidase [Chthoniobacterales bacterium]
MTPEHRRLEEDQRREKNWKRWGPYLSERQWGTVREDYSETGEAWEYFPHDHARSRAYRWGEDGLLGFTDRECRLCFSLALWNGQDAILKERLYGLTGHQGNHGEDVKEHYYYLDSTPTHSYCKALYKYPQAAFPYDKLVAESARRSRLDPEYEIEDTGVFNESRYFDIFVEYAKDDPDDIYIRITAHNRGPEAAPLHLLPTLWFRNSWIWGCRHDGCSLKPSLWLEDGIVRTRHQLLEGFTFWAAKSNTGVAPEWLFTENETNSPLFFNSPSYTSYFKDAFHRRVVNGELGAVSPKQRGTKAAAWYQTVIPAGGEVTIDLRLAIQPRWHGAPSQEKRETVFGHRLAEADTFYRRNFWDGATPEEANVMRQSYAGLLWSKQFYHYVVEDWLDGDPTQPVPPEGRKLLRNHNWRHLFNRDIISMPDKWEYPWYAAWDLAFHMIPMAEIDPDFAKQQLLVFLREWYMHPNGALPAYEWNLSDVNPPVQAWAAWRVYKISAPEGQRDRDFLARTFQKLVMNFTWWINRKDDEGHNVFSGGFLGLDNVGVFDRSKPLPNGAKLQQADGTAWMGFYCGSMLSMAIELALERPVYEDMASKFFEHFIRICDAINGAQGNGLWDDEDGFYYDQMLSEHERQPLKVRSVVGWIPLLAVELIDRKTLDKLPGFAKRARWFLENRGDLSGSISYLENNTQPHDYLLLAMPTRDRLRRTLSYVFDEDEFLSPYGLRSLSKWHQKNPYTFAFDGGSSSVSYDPGESTTGLFGGNSNWRGPIWFPVNYLFIEALERYHRYYGDSFKIEYPTRSGKELTLGEIAKDISARLGSLFLRDASGKRPFDGPDWPFSHDPHFRDYALFHEYFHGDTGRGLGASHQTGWTALATRCLSDRIWQRHHQK